ncbi:MAG: ABC transporter substrate-binding protein [Clostridia bacterium]|nr:ABC transporter substrate-binding protein [Clostridia bacterium]
MKNFRRIAALVVALVMVLAFAACGKETTNGDDKPVAGKVYKIGVIQLMEHDALDAAYNGFKDTLNAEYPGQFDITLQNAQGEQANCVTIANNFVANNYDLILAIATPAAQAAKQATGEIPILVTAVTDPADAGLVDSNEVPGGNLSGTSDLNPIAQQANLLLQLAPEVKTVGVLYNSGEDNSVFQYELAKEALEALGIEVQAYTVADSSQIQTVCQSAVGKIDAAYIGTDNLLASSMPIVSQVLTPAGIPVICGEANMVNNGGTATYGLNYYTLGQKTAAQAIDVLLNGADISNMPIGYCSESELDLTINAEIIDKLGITLPAELQAVVDAATEAVTE